MILAHLVATGAGSIFDGFAHFFLSPDNFVPVLALALLAAMRGDRAAEVVFLVLPPSWLCGGLSGLFLLSAPLPAEPVTVAAFLGLGLLLALDRRLPAWAIGFLAAAVGAALGAGNGQAFRAAGTSAGVAQVFGASVPGGLLAVYASLLLGKFNRPWMRIVVRVAGSWIAASGLLLLGWAIRARS
jgi:urease accessory protein